jgi:methionine-rich copper-binding protein CopC
MAYEKNIGRFPEKVELDFDEQGEAGLLALEWYRLIAPHFPAEYKEIFGRSPTMLDDEDYMPLQAADMLAWSVRRDLDPDEYAADWSWLWSELYKITWAGHAFTSESWESVTKMLGI